jgi:hypothetical protein
MRLRLYGHTIVIREHQQAALRELEAGRTVIWAMEPDDPDSVPMEIEVMADDTSSASASLYAEERP